jgi:hypothetical protein
MRDFDEKDSVSYGMGLSMKGDGLAYDLTPGAPDGVSPYRDLEFQALESLFQY